MSSLHVCRILTRPYMGNGQKLPKIAENLQGSTAVADSGISTVHICVVEILGSGNYFDDPLHICFVVRKENKTHIENIACMLQLKYMHVRQSDFTKTNPPKNHKGREGRQLRGSWIHL